MTEQAITDALAGVAQGMKPFRPVAYYDEHMDVIYVELRNCSLMESRVNGWLTMLYDNHPEEGQTRCVGLSIKGVKHFAREMGWSESGVYRVVDGVNKLLDKYHGDVPEENLREVKDCVVGVIRDSELSVNYAPV